MKKAFRWLIGQYNWWFRHCWRCGKVGVETYWVFSPCIYGLEDKVCAVCHKTFQKIELQNAVK